MSGSWLIWIVGGVRKNHDRRLQTLRAVDRHHPRQPLVTPRLALEFPRIGIEPLEKPDEA